MMKTEIPSLLDKLIYVAHAASNEKIIISDPVNFPLGIELNHDGKGRPSFKILAHPQPASIKIVKQLSLFSDFQKKRGKATPKYFASQQDFHWGSNI